MSKIFVRLWIIFAVAIGSSTSAQTIYVLDPVGKGGLQDVLGENTAISASGFYDFMKSTWKIPTVDPIYNGAVISNVQDLIPYEVLVVPKIITIRASQIQGGKYDYNRQRTAVASPLPVTVNPAEDTVFVYALNKDGKLIYPYVRNGNGDGKVSVVTKFAGLLVNLRDGHQVVDYGQ